MTVKELLELLNAYVLSNLVDLNDRVVNPHFFEFNSVDVDVDENGDTGVVID